MANGDRYEGEWRAGPPHGQGPTAAESTMQVAKRKDAARMTPWQGV